MSRTAVAGLPDVWNWPGLTPKPERDELLRRDAQVLARKHGGGLVEAMMALGIQVEPETEARMRQAAIEDGVPIAPGGEIRGLFGTLLDGSGRQLVQAGTTLDPQQLVETLAHELGHCRAATLFGDISEPAAEVWAEAWLSAA